MVAVVVSAHLRRAEGGWSHWCPACDEMHHFSDDWIFDGNLLSPTFAPSMDIRWRDGERCHYFLYFGQIQYCSDSTHELAGRSVPLPELPPELAL